MFKVLQIIPVEFKKRYCEQNKEEYYEVSEYRVTLDDTVRRERVVEYFEDINEIIVGDEVGIEGCEIKRL